MSPLSCLAFCVLIRTIYRHHNVDNRIILFSLGEGRLEESCGGGGEKGLRSLHILAAS